MEGTSSLIEKVSPRTFEFLLNEQGYTRPEPDAVEFHGLNIDNFRNAIADFEAGNSFTSHSTGLMMGSTSRGKKDGKWTHEDRAYAAMIQGVKRGVQAAGVGLSAGGVVGSAVPGVGTVAVGLAGAVMGGTIGTIYGVMEGANNPELSGIPPSGIETKTSTKTEVGLTKSEADEKSGITTTTTPKKTTTTVTTKNLETGEENEVTTVVEKKEVMHDCSAGRVCVLSDIKKDGAGCDKPDDGYGDVAISKDAQEKAHKKFRERLRIMQDALILTLEPRFKSSDGMNKAYLEALRMSLVRPATPDEMNKPRGPLDGNFRPENPLLDPVRDRMRKIGL
ncbi:MAG TPA: hypothetical protein VE954_15815 [Oligoflexus sp.]|uniref:hypothetical protein n=1 Tax=Oligoflexus sp. TaxID=1971216 RepID=UPI002D6AAA5D|nr:hypothetical protein [Oligoflexus sp.]HYX34566.1 hypothetical protein [Oligoflexus sp.]